MSHGAWLKWAKKSETPTHTDTCPDCRGRGTRLVGAVDNRPIYERCWKCDGTGEIGAVLVKGARDDREEVVRMAFSIDGHDPMKLSHDGEEKPMAKATRIQLARGGPRAANRCPSCDGPYDIAVSGTGWTACPHCDTRLHFDGSGEVTEGEVISASAGYGLTPIERRIARQLGVTFDEAQAAKKLYG